MIEIPVLKKPCFPLSDEKLEDAWVGNLKIIPDFAKMIYELGTDEKTPIRMKLSFCYDISKKELHSVVMSPDYDGKEEK